MAEDVVQMDYQAAEEMIKSIQKARDVIEQMAGDMAGIAEMVDEGLVNQRGKQWSGALRSKVAQNLKTAHDLLDELAKDVDGAKRDLQFGDKSGSSKFRD
jgi:hypothetical protein